MNSKYALVLALVLGLIAAFAVQRHIAGVEAEAQKLNEPVGLVSAKENIAAGTQLRADLLESKDLPQRFMSEQFVTWNDQDKLLGKVASQNIPKGDLILKQLVEVNQPPPPTTGISNGRRAYTIATDLISGVAGMIKPGDRVDVLGHLRDLESGPAPRRGAPAASGGQSVSTVVLLEDVLVLGVGAYGGRHTGGRGRDGADSSSVTLSVKPLEAEVLAHVQKEGALSLALRREGDRTQAQPEAVDSKTLAQTLQKLRAGASAP